MAMTDNQLAAIRARADHATPGPWEVGNGYDGFVIDAPSERIAGNYDCEGGICSTAEDAAFIAHARNDIPALLAEIAQLRTFVAAFTEKEPKGATYKGSPMCAYCGCFYDDQPHKSDCPYAMAVAYVEAMRKGEGDGL